VTESHPKRHILGVRVDRTTYAEATRRILDWAERGVRGYVCAANVHMVMEAHDSPAFGEVLRRALLVTADGMPLVWALRALGLPDAQRVYGPTLMMSICAAAAAAQVPVALYGGAPGPLTALERSLLARFPSLTIRCAVSPPFRALSPDEDEALTERVRRSGARIVFVGLGCPKQEQWMSQHTDRLDAILVGVGAAFDFHSGRVLQAPAVLQAAGLEWAFRLAMEPRRLWRRYARHNPRFVGLFLAQWMGRRKKGETA
jgi:N-acetylglucosaminyldiphosphoundecaprenol N-acetyl-beta-D-mannosaminyltransferase